VPLRRILLGLFCAACRCSSSSGIGIGERSALGRVLGFAAGQTRIPSPHHKRVTRINPEGLKC